MVVKKIPQVIAIVPLTTGYKLSLVKQVRSHLGVKPGDGVSLNIGDEVLLQLARTGEEVLDQVGQNAVTLPEGVFDYLDLNSEQNTVALVERDDAIAVKRVETSVTPASWANLSDLETARDITRRLGTNAMPDKLLPALLRQYEGLTLQYDLKPYLQEMRTFDGWKSRQLLQIPAIFDTALQEELIEDRLKCQSINGSWEDDLFMTARNLRELDELGVPSDEKSIKSGAGWLLDCAQSRYNPGMFFGSDELVAAQAVIVAQREITGKGRFREIRGPEKRAVMAGDGLIRNPCGPRIMWPNALTVETLLRLGYEDHPRMQASLAVLASRDWCECGYQLGMAQWQNAEPMDEEAVSAFEQRCINQYRYGGLEGPEYLLGEATLAKCTHVIRETATHTPEGIVFDLRMPDHIQGCEFITARALAQVKKPLLRRFAEAHLWRFAGIQRAPDGEFPRERYGTGFDQAGILEAVSRYEHPASNVIVMRALPWVVQSQNPDGSWGGLGNKDLTTLAVIKALLSLGRWLPEAFIPSLASAPG